jgi:hypothetical protein
LVDSKVKHNRVLQLGLKYASSEEFVGEFWFG